MCLAAEKDDQGGPVFTIEDLPPKSSPGLTVSRPEIYYGSEMSGYQIVPTGVKEFDYPKGDQNVYTSYAGHGGVLLDSFWKKALFAWHQFDMSIVLSSYLSPQSRIQLWRPVQERVSRIAPFLKLDRDPYLVARSGTAVLDPGRLYRRRRVSLFRADRRRVQLHSQLGEGRGRCLSGRCELLRHRSRGSGPSRRTMRPCRACSARSTKCRLACANICAIRRTSSKSRSTNSTPIT